MRGLLLLLVVAVLPAAAAGEEESALRESVAGIMAAPPGKARDALKEALLATAPDARALAALLEQGRAYGKAVPTGWLRRTVRGGDGKERPYLLHVPIKYTPAERYRLLVDMHGGISRPRPLTHDELEQMKFFWGEQAETDGFFLALPTGETGAEWWTAAGAGGVLRILEETRALYNIDENQVFATGFSDGGSGSYYLALAHPTPLAGIIPLNGHPAVAAAGGLQVHLRALLTMPIYAINTEHDALYPPASVRPIVDLLKEAGAPVVWREIAGFGHEPSYLPEARPAIVAWMQALRRQPHPRTILWEGAGPARVRWIDVREVTGVREGDAFPDLNPKLPPPRARLGIAIEQAFAGPGVKIQEVFEGSPAAKAGVAPGDILVGLDDVVIAAMADLRRALAVKAHGDPFRLEVLRDGVETALEGRFPEARAEEAFSRGKPYGSLRAEVEGNRIEIRRCGVGAIDLYLSDRLVDLEQPVRVVVDGRPVHEGPVARDARFLLEQALRDQDRTMVYAARLRIEH
ncbi:MAG: PDZ domain-containing protein [Planctomycetaceae bacterium]